MTQSSFPPEGPGWSTLHRMGEQANITACVNRMVQLIQEQLDPAARLAEITLLEDTIASTQAQIEQLRARQSELDQSLSELQTSAANLVESVKQDQINGDECSQLLELMVCDFRVSCVLPLVVV